MAENSAIEWTDHTFNPWIGCQKVSPGCDHCYAEQRMDTRLHVVNWGAGQPRKRTSAANWKLPLKWNAQPYHQCAACGWRGNGGIDGIRCPNIDCSGTLAPARQRVFCASLADVFDNEVPAAWRQDLMSLIARTQHLDWLLLTKRIGNARRMLRDASMHDGLLLTANDEYRPPPNLWIGATTVNQEEADRDIPKLLAVPARVRFLSMEPLLGPVNLTGLWRHWNASSCEPGELPELMIDWVIVGGESGHSPRPMHPGWVRSLRDQCVTAGVAFFMKQMTKKADIPADLLVREFPHAIS